MSVALEYPTMFFNNEYNCLKNKKNEDIDIYLSYFSYITKKSLIFDYRFFNSFLGMLFWLYYEIKKVEK